MEHDFNQVIYLQAGQYGKSFRTVVLRLLVAGESGHSKMI